MHRFHWRSNLQYIKCNWKRYQIFQQAKGNPRKLLGIPAPLDVSDRRQGSIGSPCITPLPLTKKGFGFPATYVNGFTKRAHFIPFHSSDTAVEVAKSFYENVFSHHGLTKSVVPERDRRFTFEFWRHLMNLFGAQLRFSTIVYT